MTAETASYPGLFENYLEELRADGAAHDDLLVDHLSEDGSTAAGPVIQELASEGIDSVARQVDELVDAEGVSFGHSGPPSANWRLDPLPILLPAGEWRLLEEGIRQRSILLDLVLTDLYGPRTLLHERVLPPEIVLGHEGFLGAVDQMSLPTRRQLVLGATDLVRAPGGRWTVVSDHTQAPTGAGYAMADRRIVSRVLDRLYRSIAPRRLRGFFDLVELALLEAAPTTQTPTVVLLTAGPTARASYDEALTATLLGHPLAQADDLLVEDGRLWLRTIGKRQPVDVVLRRVDARNTDPLDLRPESRLGAPGIVAACNAGRLSVVNHLGAGVLENPALVGFLPALCRRLLGEDLLLPQPATWWCGDPAAFSHVRAHIEDLVIRPISRSTASPLLGWTLGESARRRVLARIAEQPWAWVGQEFVEGATAPAVGPDGLVPRSVVLRSFQVAVGEDIHLLQGGMARLTPVRDQPLTGHPEGSVVKDVWVLPSEESSASTPSVLLVNRYPEDDDLDRRLPPITPRAASNLYWLGRYGERTGSTARLLMVVDNLVNDHLYRPGTPGHTAMTTMLDALAAVTGVQAGEQIDLQSDPPDKIEDMVSLPQLRRTMLDAQTPGSVAFDVAHTRETADRGRALLSGDTSASVARLAQIMAEAESERDHILLQPVCAQVLSCCLALAGIARESTVRDEIWAFLEIGRRFERARSTLRLVSATLTLNRPPIAESLVAETALRACDSMVTYRRRMVAGVGPSTPVTGAMDLLVRDVSNPRSVVHQFRAMEAALELVPDEDTRRGLLAMQTRIGQADFTNLCLHDRTGLASLLAELESRTEGLAERFQDSHFAPQQNIQSFSVYETQLALPGHGSTR